MLGLFTVSFFGHRTLRSAPAAEKKLQTLVRALLLEKEYVDFLVGRDGDFDLLAASVVRAMKRAVRSDNSSLVWVTPYPTAEFQRHERAYLAYYDGVEVCPEAASAHFRAAHRNRNRALVERSDLVVCWVERRQGGAFQAMEYAHRRGKAVLNLAEEAP